MIVRDAIYEATRIATRTETSFATHDVTRGDIYAATSTATTVVTQAGVVPTATLDATSVALGRIIDQWKEGQ